MKFSELNLHPALAATLAARGYDTATPVQAAVLAPESAGRDLLVSSETGSGKTIAFGVALAETLLGPAAADGSWTKPTPGANPVALVIVPTRELAAQVREELSWLLQKTGLRSAPFTGGTPVSGDLRILQRGVDLVIGTPGRLVDLLRRERLKLSDLKVVVLDEADEMLDLGFREDLETILKTAPATRRTLLLSATLPSEIRAMARKFQRDALAVDPRKPGADGAAPRAAAHSDITYVAHLIAGGDRLAAVVNVLRAGGNPRSIVFCTTREGVATTHAALVARGFSAVAISGDRVQAERDRALDQLRGGEVQVLVATNVAARGLHLPDVDLIVHADLPLNAESLTHRSGRTGRAGRKGTAVVIARVVERYKAERLLASAHVKPVWTPAPSAQTIAAAARERLLQELAAEPEADDSGADDLLKRLDGQLDLPALARRLLARELARLPSGEPLAKVPMPAPGTGPRDDRGPGRSGGFSGASGAGSSGSGPPRSRAEMSRGGVVFRVNIGGNDNADPRWLLPLICRRGGVTRREVGAIRIAPRETLFEIAGNAAAEFAAAAAEVDPRARHVVIERADATQRAPEAPRAMAPHKPQARSEEARPARHEEKPARPTPSPETEARPAHPPAAAHEPQPRPAETHKPRPTEAHKPRPAEAHKPQPAEAHKPRSTEGHKPLPRSTEGHKAQGRPETARPARHEEKPARSGHGHETYGQPAHPQASPRPPQVRPERPLPGHPRSKPRPEYARPSFSPSPTYAPSAGGRPAYGRPAYPQSGHPRSATARPDHADPAARRFAPKGPGKYAGKPSGKYAGKPAGKYPGKPSGR
jgi:ATP-dependent RNA helicase DeaD